MLHSNKPDLVLSVPCGAGRAHTWVLNPANSDTFRIVVRCSQEEVAAPTSYLRPAFSQLSNTGCCRLWRFGEPDTDAKQCQWSEETNID